MSSFTDQKEIQNNLLRWLTAVGSATWKEINQTLVGMLLSYGSTDDNENLKYPAYKWFEPLFRNGVIEAFFDKEVKYNKTSQGISLQYGHDFKMNVFTGEDNQLCV